MSIRDWLRPPRLLLVLFFWTSMAFLAGLGWLGWDALSNRQAKETVNLNRQIVTSTDLIAGQVRQTLADIDTELSRLSIAPEATLADLATAYAKNLRDDGVIVVFAVDGARAYPSGHLLYYPDASLPAPELPPVSVFAAGEEFEDKEHDFDNAIAEFEELKTSDNVRTRAGALVRLARNHRRAGHSELALKAYSELASLGDVAVESGPADLVARAGRCDVLHELHRSAELAREARALAFDLDRGRWQLTHGAYQVRSEDVRQWLAPGAVSGPMPAMLAIADSVEYLWQQWQRDPRAPDLLSIRNGNRKSHERSMLLLGHSAHDRFVALVAGPDYISEAIMDPLLPTLEAKRVGVVLADGEGRTVVEHGVTNTDPAVPDELRTMNQTRLPWQLRVVSAAPSADPQPENLWLLVGAVSFVALLVVAGTYFSARAMTREIEAVKLQSDFVAAVSHEFRTPLTLLRQFSDMLADGRVSSDDDRLKYYAALQRGTRRLTRLVENLLDFGRMEAGSHAFKLETFPAKAWLEELTAEFEQEVKGQGYGLDVSWQGPPTATLRADQTALGRAVWNLLENAVKYSPVNKSIAVTGTFDDSRVVISVRDRGIGVPPEERHSIFKKFVRGSTHGGHVVKGTGLGLALVEQIVQAHGGTVDLDSTVGEGSTFSISLPAAA